MITIPEGVSKAITDAAENAYPHECCGLLTGWHDRSGATRIHRMVASRNLAATDTRDSFEVDPQVRFDLMRELAAASTGETLVGHYHSHPDHPARPSQRDLAMALEPDLIWLIVGVNAGIATEITAHKIDESGSQFHQLPLHVEPATP